MSVRQLGCWSRSKSSTTLLASTHLQLGGEAARSGRVGSPHLVHTSHTLPPEGKPIKVLVEYSCLDYWVFVFRSQHVRFKVFLFLLFLFLCTESPQGQFAKRCRTCLVDSGWPLSAVFVIWLISWLVKWWPHLKAWAIWTLHLFATPKRAAVTLLCHLMLLLNASAALSCGSPTKWRLLPSIPSISI